MRNSYIIPEPYANENERIKAYENALQKEKPAAKVISKGKHFWRYVANTKIGSIFFEYPISYIEKFELGDTIPGWLCKKWIKI